MRRLQLLIFACVSLGISPVSAQDVVAGASLARKQCAGCHQIGEHPKPGLGLAPAFVKIASAKGMTQISIGVFLRTSHEVMPNFVLSEREISDVAAYIISLRAKVPPRPR
jgi:mono/diheme cytochrome c family protein